MARLCEAKIAELQAELAYADSSQQKAIKRHIKINRHMLKWCKSRAGYVKP